jgi:hypothetical protein
MSGGGSGLIANLAQAQQAPGNPGGVEYTPVATPGHYSAQYADQSPTPFLQSVMAQHGMATPQNNSLGLPSLQSMFGMQQANSPLQSGIQQLAPMAPYMGSSYRPDMSGAMASLRNVAPPVTYEQMHPTPPSTASGGSDGGGGGGGGGD